MKSETELEKNRAAAAENSAQAGARRAANRPAPVVCVVKDRCKGCGLCVAFCPVQVLRMSGAGLNIKGYPYAEYVPGEKVCIGCGQCALVCPDVAIQVEFPEEE